MSLGPVLAPESGSGANFVAQPTAQTPTASRMTLTNVDRAPVMYIHPLSWPRCTAARRGTHVSSDLRSTANVDFSSAEGDLSAMSERSLLVEG